MAQQSIPERAPVGDLFNGFVLQLGGVQVLSMLAYEDASVIASGEFIVRYGLRFLGKLHQSIVPGLVVLDYGQMITGEEAWEFLIKHSNLHPRAEVVGYLSDGSEDMVFIRSLDMAVQPEVLLYDDQRATKPSAQPVGLIAPDSEDLPERLRWYLPIYASLEEWRNVNE